MNIDDLIRLEPQRSIHDEIVSSLIVVKHMTFSGYGYTQAEDVMWDGLRSPMLRFAIDIKVWGEISQRQDAYLCAAQTALGESTKHDYGAV